MNVAPAWGYLLSLFSCLALLGLWLYWVTVWGPMPASTKAPTLMMSTLPLLFNLRGLVHDIRRSYVWLGLLSLGYFMHGISASGRTQDFWPAAVETGLSLMLFSGCLTRLRSNSEPS